jgi:hypothetical protein
MHWSERCHTDRNGLSSRRRRVVALSGSIAALLTAATAVWGQGQKPHDPGLGPALLLLPAVLCSFTALQLVLWVLAPAPLGAVCRAIARGRARCLLSGALTAGICLSLISALGPHQGAGQMACALILGVVALGGLSGISAVIALLGQGIMELGGRTVSRTPAVVVGSLAFGFAVPFPVVGWALGIYFLLIGLGGAIQALLRAGGPQE